LSEQHRIVKILDSAFAKIEALRANAQQNFQNTKDFFQASLKQELSPKQGWESKRLNEICEVKDGTHDSPKYVDDGIPFVTQKNITAKGFDIQDTRKITLSDHEKFYKRSNVEYGDILISMIGANRGMSCLVDVRDTFSIKNVGLVKQRDTIKQRYLLYYLQSPISAKYVADASNGGAQEFIGLTALRAFPILFPKNSEEQQTIVEKLDALSERCRAMEENYRQTITHCNALKQALLTKAFNGEL
ncbi:MAG: restriction endonuclease subunit S, partial [Muribaculaceae bacterium]